jgi:hypothetical protein
MTMTPNEPRVAALDDAGLAWAQRVVWVVCLGVYLTVFVGGIYAGGAELITVGRAALLTLVAAVLGKMALNLLANASLPILASTPPPVEQGPMANEEGKLGSLADLGLSANVPQHEDEAIATVSRERQVTG